MCAMENFVKSQPYVAGSVSTTLNYRFVKLATAAQTVDDATAGSSSNGDVTEGIRRNTPTATGRPLEVVVHPGDITKLTLGSGGASKGNYLKSDAYGAGIVASVDGDNVGAEALEAGIEGDTISVRILKFPLRIHT